MAIDKIQANLFFAAVVIGMVGGILGNFVVTSFFRVFDIKQKWINVAILIIALVSFFGFMIYLYDKIK